MVTRMKKIAAILFAAMLLTGPLDVFAQLKPPPDLVPELSGPRLDTYVVRVIPTKEARLAAFEAGEIDEVALEADEVERIAKNKPDAFFLLTQGRIIVPMQFNLRRYPISELPFRMALAHAIDRDFVINQILKGFGVPVTSVVLPIWGDWANPNVRTYEFNMQKAEQVLDEAGFKKGADGLRIDPKTGKTLREIELITVNEQVNPVYYRVGRYIISQMEKLGFKVIHTPVTTTIYTARIPNLEFDMYFNGWSLGTYPTFMGRFWHTKFDVKRGTNRYGVKDAVVDKLSDDFLNAPTEAEAQKVLHQLEAKIQEIIPWIPVYSPVSITAISGKMAGVVLERATGQTQAMERSFAHYLTLRQNDLPLGGDYDDVSSAEFANLNPMWYLFVNEGFILSRVFEPLAQNRPDDFFGAATDRLRRLAENWTQEIFEVDGKKKTRITFKLRANATWHDGLPVTAEDVRWTIEVPGKQWETRRQFTDLAETITPIESVEVPDRHTVVITINGANWVHLHNLQFLRILPKHVWGTMTKEEAQATDPSVKVHPKFPFLTLLIGSGAYILKEHVPGTSIVLVWNPSYIKPNSEKTVDLKVQAAAVYDDEKATVQLTVRDYLKQPVTNARVLITVISSAGITVKEIEASHVGEGKYVADLGQLPAETYKIRAFASVPVVFTTALGAPIALAKTTEATLSVTASLQRLVLPVSVAILLIIAGLVVLAVRARRKPKPELFTEQPAP